MDDRHLDALVSHQGVELHVGANGFELGAAGIIVINPPWRLADELKAMLAPLARILARGRDAGCKVDWLLGEN